MNFVYISFHLEDRANKARLNWKVFSTKKSPFTIFLIIDQIKYFFFYRDEIRALVEMNEVFKVIAFRTTSLDTSAVVIHIFFYFFD